MLPVPFAGFFRVVRPVPAAADPAEAELANVSQNHVLVDVR